MKLVSKIKQCLANDKLLSDSFCDKKEILEELKNTESQINKMINIAEKAERFYIVKNQAHINFLVKEIFYTPVLKCMELREKTRNYGYKEDL